MAYPRSATLPTLTFDISLKRPTAPLGPLEVPTSANQMNIKHAHAAVISTILAFAGGVDASVGDPVGPLQKIASDSSEMTFYSSAGAAMDGRGNLVVIWVEESFTTRISRIMGQRLAPDGTRLGNPFLVGPAPVLRKQGDQPVPAVIAMADDGRFVVAWNSTAGTGHTHVRAFDADANPTTPDIDLALSIDGLQLGPGVAIGPDGSFAVTWAEEIQTGIPVAFTEIPVLSAFRIRLQRFDANGHRHGLPIEVATSFSDYVANHSKNTLNHEIGLTGVAIDDDGVTSVVWTRSEIHHHVTTTQLAAFDTHGRRIGPDVSIPDADYPSLAVDRFGRRLVAFLTGPHLQSGVQRFDPSGAAASQRVDNLGPVISFTPQIAVRPDGDALLVVDVGARDGARVLELDTGLNPAGPIEVMAAKEQYPAQNCVPAASRASVYAVACTVSYTAPRTSGSTSSASAPSRRGRMDSSVAARQSACWARRFRRWAWARST